MKTITYLDTTIAPSYEEYVEWCELNELEPKDENSNDYWDYVYLTRDMDCGDFWDNLKYSRIDDQYNWIVSGTLGLWQGDRDICQTMFNSLEDAIRKCLGRCDDIIIKKRGSVIYVTGLHHDGRNNFEIRALTDLGVERFERLDSISLRNRENIVTLPKYLY